MSTLLDPTIPPVPYADVRDTLQTGDVLFFQGGSTLDFMIQTLDEVQGLAPYSHVGMVVRDGSGLYLWDAPGPPGPDNPGFPDPWAADPANRAYPQSGGHDGCRIAPMDDVLAFYSGPELGTAWVRHLSPGVSEAQATALRIFVDRVDGLPFPTPLSTAFPANYAAGLAGGTLYTGTFFCSQLVAASYQHMGLLSMDRWPANSYVPGSFATDDPTKLPLVAPASLGQVVHFTLPT